MAMAQRNLGEVMTDADLMDAIEALRDQEPHGEVSELLKMMSENRMISWEEAEQILGGGTYNCPIKSSLPQQTRPSEPDNDTDVDWSIQQLQRDDPKLKQVNLNNMKRTPIPQVKRLLAAIKDNTHLEKIALANMGLYDHDCEPIFDVIENNTTLKSINLETNYLSGDFFARLFKAALVNQTLEEVKAVNQGVTFATTAEKEIIDAVFENRGLTKVSISLRLPEGRHKIENAMIRNQEIRRILRRQAAAAARAAEEAQKQAEEANKPVAAKQEAAVKKSLPSAGKQPPGIVANAGKAPPAINGDVRKAPPGIIGSTGKAPPAVLGKAPPAVFSSKETKEPSASRGAAVSPKKAVPPAKTPTPPAAAEPPVKTVEPKKTVEKKTVTKAPVENGTTAAAAVETAKPTAKKTVPKKKISMEQALPELELDSEEVSKKAPVPKKSPLAAKKRSVQHEASKSAAPESNDSNRPVRKNNPTANSAKKSTESTQNKDPTPSVQPAEPEKPVNRIRNSRLVPAVFLAADETNGPVKRNFIIPSKKDSTDREKVAAKLAAIKKSSLPANPFSEPMQVYPLKRNSIADPPKFA